ncbi:MAG: hypothetical protein Q8R67_17340 [Rhodoferax sp.]|nr:hypothetical protein [Rhodoferax sp.]MDP3653434.1 hypothetical protein [Rhodoferax sp.]
MGIDLMFGGVIATKLIAVYAVFAGAVGVSEPAESAFFDYKSKAPLWICKTSLRQAVSTLRCLAHWSHPW